MDKREKIVKITDLWWQIDDPVFKEFFDLDSEKMLDEKINVMEDLIAGKSPGEIKDYYRVLENYPDNRTRW